MAYSYTLTPKDIYGTDDPEIPKGFKSMAFRLPKLRDIVLTVRMRMAVPLTDLGHIPLGPRLILEKLPEKRSLCITNCVECFYRREITGRKLPICSHPAVHRFLNEDLSIPEWCPLPKAP